MYVYFSLLGLILSAAVNLYFIRKGWGLIGVAMGTSLTYFLYSFVSLTYSLRHFVNKAFVLYSILGRIFSPFLYILCGIALLNKLFVIFLGPSYDQADLATALTKIGFFVIWVLPMAIFFVRNKKLISEFRELKKALGLYPV